MKRIAILVFSLAMAAALCACGCTNKEPATTPSNDSAPSTQTDKMPTDTMTIPVPETNVPDTGVDNDTMTGGSTGGTDGGIDGGAGRGLEGYNSPMPDMQ